MPERILPAPAARGPVTTRDALLMLTVHKYDGSFSEGEIANAHMLSSVGFQGYGDLLLKMERIYDLLEIPGFGREIKGKSNGFQWTATDLELSLIHI